MPKCLTHEQVKNRFIDDLRALCVKHQVYMHADAPITVHIEPVYNKDTGLYEEYGADFDIGFIFAREN